MSEPIDFEAWYLERYSRVLVALVGVAGDVELGREATDEAFTRALERWDRVGRMASPSGWTYTVGINLLRRSHQRRELERRALQRSTDRVGEPPATLSVEVWDAVRAIPRREREAVALRYLGGLTERQTAEVMGVSTGNVARMLHDARQRLGDMLGEPSKAPGRTGGAK